MNPHSRWRWRGSSAPDGSSSSSTGGSASRPTAMFTRWRLPPDSSPSSSSARSASAVCSSIRCDRRLEVVDLLQAREQAQVLRDGELHVDGGLLRDPADPAVGVGPLLLDRAAVGLADAGEHRQQRRLAGAVGADDRQQLAASDLEAHVAHRLAIAEALADALARRASARRAAVVVVVTPGGPLLAAQLVADRLAERVERRAAARRRSRAASGALDVLRHRRPR